MTIVVPFDGTPLSEAALSRGREMAELIDEELLVVSVVPDGNAVYARERGWLQPEESFDLDLVVSRLRERATAIAPAATVRHLLVDRFAPTGTIANRIRELARNEDASLVVVGSENAGRFVLSIASVGATVAAGETYDVLIIRKSARTDGGRTGVDEGAISVTADATESEPAKSEPTNSEHDGSESTEPGSTERDPDEAGTLDSGFDRSDSIESSAVGSEVTGSGRRESTAEAPVTANAAARPSGIVPDVHHADTRRGTPLLDELLASLETA